MVERNPAVLEQVLERVQRNHQAALPVVPEVPAPDDFDTQQTLPWRPALLAAACGYLYTLAARISPVVGSALPYINALALLLALASGVAGIGLNRFDTLVAPSKQTTNTS